MLAVIVTAGLVSAVMLAPGGAGAGSVDIAKTTKIKLGDNFYKPNARSVKKGTRVRFKWTGSNTHNVTLKKGPGKKFKSGETSTKGINLVRKFKKRGTYKIVCTIHPAEMKLNLKVT